MHSKVHGGGAVDAVLCVRNKIPRVKDAAFLGHLHAFLIGTRFQRHYPHCQGD